jgi:hypothetical protein
MFRLPDPAADAGFGISIRIEPASTRGTAVSTDSDPCHGLDIRLLIHSASVARQDTSTRPSTTFQSTIGPIRQYVE